MARKDTVRRPAHWPENVQYITVPQYHVSVPIEIRNHIRGTHAGQLVSGSQESPYMPKSSVVIRLIAEPAHPACGQYGLFAAKKIPPRSLILDYVGEIHCENRLQSDYDLSSLSVGIDAQLMGNEARFINDYRGVKARPNVLFQDRRTNTGELRVSVWTGTDAVRKGEELLVSYGKSWWRGRQAPEPSIM
ncbi:SET domain protein [Trametes gibbosa]|nr:SET domain protein [Trametes gibbosa]